MDVKKERVFAYSMAKEIDLSEQAEVSGGSYWTTRMTAGASGGSGMGGEAHIDCCWDF